MLIGDTVTYDGWNCVVVGFTPTSVRPAQVELSDPRTGTTFWVDLDLAGLPAEGVESFIGGTTRVEKDGKKWSGFVTAADLDDDAIHLTVQAVEADAWQPE